MPHSNENFNSNRDDLVLFLSLVPPIIMVYLCAIQSKIMKASKRFLKFQRICYNYVNLPANILTWLLTSCLTKYLFFPKLLQWLASVTVTVLVYMGKPFKIFTTLFKLLDDLDSTNLYALWFTRSVVIVIVRWGMLSIFRLGLSSCLSWFKYPSTYGRGLTSLEICINLVLKKQEQFDSFSWNYKKCMNAYPNLDLQNFLYNTSLVKC